MSIPPAEESFCPLQRKFRRQPPEESALMKRRKTVKCRSFSKTRNRSIREEKKLSSCRSVQLESSPNIHYSRESAVAINPPGQEAQ